MEFINIDDKRIKIRNQLKKQFKRINDEDIPQKHINYNEIDDFEDLLKFSKLQYYRGDDKWIITLSRYLDEKAFQYFKNFNYPDALTDSLGCLNLCEIQRDKYVLIEFDELLKKCGNFIKSCKKRIYLTYACILIEKAVEIDYKDFQKRFRSELKNLGFSGVGDEKVNLAFISALPYFAHKFDIYQYQELIAPLTTDDRFLFHTNLFLRKRKKLLRKSIFEKRSSKPVKSKTYFKEICECQFYLSEILEKLNNNVESKLELASGYRYKAYLVDSTKDKIKYFDESIAILAELRNNNFENASISKEEIEREFLFAKARKSEYLAFITEDLNDRIKHFKSADKNYGNLRDPRSFLVRFLVLYYQVKKYIIQDHNIKLAAKSINNLIDNGFDLAILSKQFPDIQYLINTCRLIKYFPSKKPTEKHLKEINLIQNESMMRTNQLMQLWELIYSYNLLFHAVGDNSELSNFFQATCATILQSGQTEEVEKVVERLFFTAPTDEISKDLIEYLKREEGEHLEFKASWSLDVKKFLFNDKLALTKSIEYGVLKTIVGFLNSSGGLLIIGVLEKRKELLGFKDKYSEKFNKLIFGIEREYKSDGYDGYIRKLEDTIRQRIDVNLLSLRPVNREVVEGHDLIKLDIPLGPKWSSLENDTFYVREYNQTISKKGVDADDYKTKKSRY